jgi:cyclopropane fatty-acyl-phospholipid synthase-like methyltransferase
MREFWNERYALENYVYGTEPNEFFSEQLSKLKNGALLLPAEGEGRNAVHAALNGWKVSAFDYSEEGKKKALKLADVRSVAIDYKVMRTEEFKAKEQYDTIALIYAHFPVRARKSFFQELQNSLRREGSLIIEVFSKDQLGRSSGGPKDPDLLYSVEEMQEHFPGVNFSMLIQEEIQLDEGPYHQGTAAVIRGVAIKA